MYLDSAILVKLVVREPDSEFFADLVDGQTGACTSELAIAECRSAFARKKRECSLDSEGYASAWKILQAL